MVKDRIDENSGFAREWFGVVAPRSKLQNYSLIKLYTRFTVAWISLIFYLKSHGVGTERELIDEMIKNLNDEKVSIIYKKNRIRIEDLCRLKIKNMHPPKHQDPYKEHEELKGALAGKDKRQIINATLKQLYIVRCNFFHGDKTWSKIDDIMIMSCATPLLIKSTGIIIGFYK